MGAWIEICNLSDINSIVSCRTLYGCVDWNFAVCVNIPLIIRSHPLWVRGLKSKTLSSRYFSFIVAPFMGAWIEIFCHVSTYKTQLVAPFMGAWIEINLYQLPFKMMSCRTLYGCVDWNYNLIITHKKRTSRTLYGCVDWNISKSPLPACK